MKQKLFTFLNKRWVRIVGLVPMAVYSYFSVKMFIGLLGDTVFRLPNRTFYPGDGVAFLGFLFFFSILFIIGILAIITAYYMKGIFRILYFAGFLGIAFVVLFMPLMFIYSEDVDFHPEIPTPEFVTGKWMDDYYQLELNSDNSYSLVKDYELPWKDIHEEHSGTWHLDRNYLYLSHLDNGRQKYWEILASDGYYFITYSIPENIDAWTGYLGLMRESDWRAVN